MNRGKFLVRTVLTVVMENKYQAGICIFSWQVEGFRWFELKKRDGDVDA